MSSIYYERMRRFKIGPHTVRLWIADFGEREEFFTMVEDRVISAMHPREDFPFAGNLSLAAVREGAAKVLELHPALNAVEIVNGNGLGSVVYRDWP